jgi:hypothetical protein
VAYYLSELLFLKLACVQERKCFWELGRRVSSVEKAKRITSTCKKGIVTLQASEFVTFIAGSDGYDV